MINIPPVTIVNVAKVSSDQLSKYLNATVLSHKVPQYTPNSPLDVQRDLAPLFSIYANGKGYCTELHNVVLSAYYNQKRLKGNKDPNYDRDEHLELEAKKEILHRTIYSLDRYYEAASRLMSSITGSDLNASRY